MEISLWFEGELPFGGATEEEKRGWKHTFQRPAELPWDEGRWFCMDIQVNQESDACVIARFASARGAETLEIEYQLLPNRRVPFRVSVDELWSRRYFLPVFPGSYKGHCKGLPMDPADVTQVEVEVRPGKGYAGGKLWRVYVADQEPAGIRPEAPMMDALGQLRDREWPTKTHGYQEMAERLRGELRQARQESENPRQLSTWGGYLQKRFQGTGWFRTQWDGTRWWLVDPEGYAFFSHGVCYGTRMGEFGWYSGMEGFYEDMPSPEDPAFAQAFTHPRCMAEYVKRNGTTSRSDDWMINPARVNMMRVFGGDWWEAWRVLATHRFRRWGLNTTGVGVVNFTDERTEDFLRLSRLPYAVTLKRFPTTGQTIFRDFPDVFSPEYADNSAAFASRELAPLADDPGMLGYFLHNEPEWLFQADYCVARELMVAERPLYSRRHLQAWLRRRYDSLEELNQAWGLSLTDWDGLLSPVNRAWQPTPEAQRLLDAYEQELILAYGQVPLQACRRVDRHHLCLGLRLNALREKAVAGSEIFDVLSFNCYKHSPQEMLELARKTGKPALIGEWHFGGQEIGLLRTALVSCETQRERGKAYRAYVEAAAANPCCVGAHYFEYNDQSLLGRFDGEHMAHGLIDCANRPYPEMARAISLTSDELYGVLTGEREPFQAEIKWLDPHW